ncbi:MAG: NADH-quinone oxidoreductase subunit C [Bacteroidetes bacterium]|nr:NADH-quinone oxidoreductase subunit C [Bacteroidota bacterium]
MDNDSLKARILEIVPEAQQEENKQYLTILVPAAKLHDLALKMKSTTDLAFDYLICLSGVDYGKQLAVVYHINSILQKHTVVIKVKTDDRINPSFDTVSDIWRTAEFHEREAYDMFGIRFNNHPDLRRIFLEEDWKGYPLRKDYVDEVNIVEF